MEFEKLIELYINIVNTYASGSDKYEKYLQGLESEDSEAVKLMIGVINNKIIKPNKELHNIIIYYSGQGDSGNNFTIDPAELSTEIAYSLVDKLIKYDYYNNDGGQGYIKISLLENKIYVEGESNYISTTIAQQDNLDII